MSKYTDYGHTIGGRKYPQIPKILFAQIVCPNPKVWDLDEKRLHWADYS